MVQTSSQDGALARYGVSREVSRSVLSCETVPDTLHATSKISQTRQVPSRGTPRVLAPLHLTPSPLLITKGESIPLRGLQGVPGLPGALQVRLVSRGNSRRATWLLPHAERPRFPSPFLRLTRGPDPYSKATLWVKAQHEGALPPPCIVRKDPRVPHTARRGA